MFVTSFRMYNAGPRAAAAWRALFERVFIELALDVRVISHGWPDPIETLWQRPDLCGDFMCGWPFVRSARAMQPIAIPVPSPPRYAGLPRYCSEFLVRADSGWNTLSQTFGHRFGWMAADSQSGFNAPRAYLASFTTAERPNLYAQVQGPLGAPASALDALRAGTVDVIALDGFYLDLSRRHQPERLGGLVTVARTPWTPIPLLVAAPGVDAGVVDLLRTKLVALHRDSSYATLLGDVLLERFVAPDLPAYAQLEAMAAYAIERGYATIS
ncbi:MAG: PhnD/SsuA/transferrin family substrate-binding protein [Caldimonas sp.]